MKLNQGLLVAAMMAGSLAVAGCSTSADEGATDESAATEQASVAMADGTVQAAAKDEGFTQDARWGRGGGFRRGEGRGFRRGEGRGFGRGEGRGFGRGEGRGRHHRAWWRFW